MDSPEPAVSSASAGRYTKLALVLVKAVLSAGLIYWATQGLDWQSLRDAWANAALGAMGLAFLAFTVANVLGALRWHWVLAQLDLALPFRLTLLITYVGHFFNTALPSTIGGDVLRVWYARQALGQGAGVLAATFIDRFNALLTMLVLAGISVLFLAERVETGVTLGAGVVLLFGIVGFVVVARYLLTVSPAILRQTSVLSVLGNTLDQLIFALKRMDVLAKSALISLAINLAIIATMYFIAAAYGYAIGFAEFLFIVPMVTLLSTLPVSIGGWGVREIVMVKVFALLGLPQEAALLISVSFGLMLILAALPGGLAWLVVRAEMHESN